MKLGNFFTWTVCGLVCTGCGAAPGEGGGGEPEAIKLVEQPLATCALAPLRRTNFNRDFVGDFIKDGHQDFVSAVPSMGEVNLYEYTNNTLKYLVGSLPTGLLLVNPMAGDFTGDGQMDLIWTGFQELDVANLGPNGLALAPIRRIGLTHDFPDLVFAADFTGDRRADVLSYHGTQIVIDKSIAASPFVEGWLTTPVQPHRSLTFPGDFNGDGKMDIATFEVSAPGNDNVLLEVADNANGFTETTVAGSPFFTPTPDYIFIGDFDGNGRADIAAVNAVPSVPPVVGVSLKLSVDPVVKPKPTGCTSSLDCFKSVSWQGTVNAGPREQTFAADFNGDHKTDLATISSDGSSIAVLLSTGSGFVTRTFTGPGDLFGARVAAGDFTGDGKADLLVLRNTCNETLYISTLTGTTTGTLTPKAF